MWFCVFFIISGRGNAVTHVHRENWFVVDWIWQNRQILTEGTFVFYPLPVSYDHIQGVMALTVFEDFVYWTDGKSKSLRRAHKTTGSQGIELLNSWQAIKSVKVYHSLRQPEGMKPICHHVCFVLCWPLVFRLHLFFFMFFFFAKKEMVLCLTSCVKEFCTFILLSSAQAPVPDCKWWMQPLMSSFSWRGTQMCLSHKFLLGCWQ